MFPCFYGKKTYFWVLFIVFPGFPIGFFRWVLYFSISTRWVETGKAPEIPSQRRSKVPNPSNACMPPAPWAPSDGVSLVDTKPEPHPCCQVKSSPRNVLKSAGKCLKPENMCRSNLPTSTSIKFTFHQLPLVSFIIIIIHIHIYTHNILRVPSCLPFIHLWLQHLAEICLSKNLDT